MDEVEKVDNGIVEGVCGMINYEHWCGVAKNISNEAIDNKIVYIKNGGITKLAPGCRAFKPAKISGADIDNIFLNAKFLAVVNMLNFVQIVKSHLKI